MKRVDPVEGRPIRRYAVYGAKKYAVKFTSQNTKAK